MKMKIATNMPFAFAPAGGVQFTNLGSGTSDTSIIVLLLPTNWGGASVENIRAATHWVSAYPAETPCYIIGCETTIPWPLAHKFLNVCLYPNKQPENCGKCDKCKRTLLALDMLGKLDLFNAVFPVEEYQKSKIDSFVYLVKNKDSSHLKGVYDHFLRTEPELVKQAEAIVMATT